MDSGIHIQLALAKLQDSLRDGETARAARCPASTAPAPADAARDGVAAEAPGTRTQRSRRHDNRSAPPAFPYGRVGAWLRWLLRRPSPSDAREF